MPSLSVWIVRLSLVYLVAGSTIGGLLLADRALALWPWLWHFRPLHVEFLLFGWMVQLAFGVASWILPRSSTPPRTRLLYLGVLLLNLGLWAAGLGAIWPSGIVLMLFGRLAELAAAVAFAVYIWPRVRSLTK